MSMLLKAYSVIRWPGGMNSLANKPQPCICERAWRQHWLKADGFLKESDEENLRTDESNSASKEELLRRNEARALRRSLGAAKHTPLLGQEAAGVTHACVLKCTSAIPLSMSEERLAERSGTIRFG